MKRELAAKVALDFSGCLRTGADTIPDSQESLGIHVCQLLENTLTHAVLKRRASFNSGLSIEDVGPMSQPRMFMRLNNAGRVAEIVCPRGDGYDELISVAIWVCANNMEMTTAWIVFGTGRNEKRPGPRNQFS